MSPGRRLAGLALLGAVASALAACGGGLDTGQLEGFVKDEIAKSVGVTVQSVDCPDDVKAKKGANFQCTAIGQDGTTAKIDVVQEDDEGHVSVTAALIHTLDVEQALAKDIGGGATLDCPDLVLIVKGDSFTCKAKDAGGGTADVVVTFDDDQGNVSYQVNPTG